MDSVHGRREVLVAAGAAVLAAALQACGGSSKSGTASSGSAPVESLATAGTTAAPRPLVSLPSTTLREVAASNPNLVVADAIETIASAHGKSVLADGQFTIFMPTVDAIGAGVSSWLSTGALPEKPSDILDVARMHVVNGVYYSADLAALGSPVIASLDGDELAIVVNGTDVTVAGAKVLETDIEFESGVIHIIDTMLMLPGMATAAASTPSPIGTAIDGAGIVSIAAAAFHMPSLVQMLQTPDITPFLPDNAAVLAEVARLAAANSLPTETAMIPPIATRHIALGTFDATDLSAMHGQALSMLAGITLPVAALGGTVSVGGAEVEESIPADGATVHVIASVIPE